MTPHPSIYPISFLAAGFAILVATGMALAPVPAQAQFSNPADNAASAPVSQGANTIGEVTSEGLRVSIIMVAPNAAQSTVNVSARIENVSETVKRIAIIGPTPQGMDDAGNVYALKAVSGIGSCKSLENSGIEWCMRNKGDYLPADIFARLQPGAQAIATLVLETAGTEFGQTLIYSMNLAVGGDDISDKTDRELVNVPLAFPPIPIKF